VHGNAFVPTMCTLLVQESNLEFILENFSTAKGRRGQAESAANELTRVLEPWRLQGMGRMPSAGSLACATAATVKARLAVRGVGLAAMAYGVLQCPRAVEALVARWTGGAWAGRLRPAWDYLLIFQSGEPMGAEPPQQRAAGANQRGRRRYGRFKPHAPPIAVADTKDDVRELAAALRGLEPHVAGGGRAALCVPMLRLPIVAWVSDGMTFGAGNTSMSDAQKAQGRAVAQQMLRELGPASAAVARGDSGKDLRALAMAAPFELVK
jgi:hypothetical protein